MPIPDHSDRSPRAPHRSQFGSADTRIGTPATRWAWTLS